MVLRLEPAARLAAPNASGVAMGHLHYRVRDVEANKKFWMALGGKARSRCRPGQDWPSSVLKFQDVLVVLEQGRQHWAAPKARSSITSRSACRR